MAEAICIIFIILRLHELNVKTGKNICINALVNGNKISQTNTFDIN